MVSLRTAQLVNIMSLCLCVGLFENYLSMKYKDPNLESVSIVHFHLTSMHGLSLFHINLLCMCCDYKSMHLHLAPDASIKVANKKMM